VRLEQRKPVDANGDAGITIDGDEDQLGQAFINLIRNAVEATLETGGGVRVDWRAEGDYVRVTIEDDGIGLPASDGVLRPILHDQPEGSGIGLTLTRLIVEAHAETVDLAARCDRGEFGGRRCDLPMRPGRTALSDSGQRRPPNLSHHNVLRGPRFRHAPRR